MTHAGKVVIVTGAGSGIGRASALRFAQRGASVAVVDRDEPTGSATVQLIRQAGGTAHFVCADVADEEGVLAYVAQTQERFGRIDCLVNNAGIEGPFQPTWQYDVSAFEHVMAVNVTSIFLGMRYVLPIMIAQRYGRIVNASSVAGLAASPGMIGYVASKHAVLGLTRTAAVEAGQYGVRVNAICPGAVDTDMMRRIGEMWNAGKAPPRELFGTLTPTRRSNTPEDVADIVLFLCSDAIGNINGIHLTTDGGRLSGLAPWIGDDAAADQTLTTVPTRR